VRAAHGLSLPHSEFVSLHPHDRQAVLELRAYDAEACPNGHHPSLVDRYVPVVVSCEMCEWVDALQKAEKPGPSQHIVLVTREEAERRAQLLADMDDDDD
jgi:hypothetical protein